MWFTRVYIFIYIIIYRSTGTGGTVSGSERVACSVVERSIDIGQLEPRFRVSAAFQRDLELAAPSRRKRRGEWRQRFAL